MQPSDFFVQPSGTPPVLVELAAEYERRCEAYDRTVCTGPADERGSVQPANARELWLISRNARQVWEELCWRARALGHTGADLKRAIAQAEA